jgi:hypothetical protein
MFDYDKLVLGHALRYDLAYLVHALPELHTEDGILFLGAQILLVAVIEVLLRDLPDPGIETLAFDQLLATYTVTTNQD